jgi:hypothetical protein
VLGHWFGDGAEGRSFWLNVITELKNRGVKEVFITSVDALRAGAATRGDPALHRASSTSRRKTVNVNIDLRSPQIFGIKMGSSAHFVQPG